MTSWTSIKNLVFETNFSGKIYGMQENRKLFTKINILSWELLDIWAASSTIIWMSHWRHTMLDGTEFWISCYWLASRSKCSHRQLIQNSAPSTIVWCQCDIQIDVWLVWGMLECQITCKKILFNVQLHDYWYVNSLSKWRKNCQCHTIAKNCCIF